MSIAPQEQKIVKTKNTSDGVNLEQQAFLYTAYGWGVDKLVYSLQKSV